VLCMLTCLMLDRLIPQATSSVWAFVRLGGVALAGLIVYGGAALASGIRAVQEATNMVMKRLKRG